MTRRVLALAAVLVVFGTSLGAELKYTMKIETRDSTTPASTPPNPMMAMIGGMVMSMIAPAGGVEMTVLVGERGVRIDYNKAYAMVPAGGSMIVGPTGAGIVVDPARKAYWKVGAADPTMLQGKAAVSVKRTGEFATVAGVRAERASFDIRMPLPIPQGMPGFPTELAIGGDTWIADEFKKYAAMSQMLSTAVGSLGLDQMAAAGFPVRSIMRSDLFPGKEVESVVTTIGEVTVPSTTFQPPAGFAEIAAPMMPMTMPMPQPR